MPSYRVATIAALALWPSSLAADLECIPSDDILDESSVALQHPDSHPAALKTLSKDAITFVDGASNTSSSSKVPKVATITCWEGDDCEVTEPVVSAWYGASGHEWTSERGADVTPQVRELLKKSMSFTTANDHFGDPAPWSTKVLMVKTQKAVVVESPAAKKGVTAMDKLADADSEVIEPVQLDAASPSPKHHKTKESLIDDTSGDILGAEAPEPENGLRGAGTRLSLEEFNLNNHSSKSGTNTCSGGSFGDSGPGMCLDTVNWYSQFLQTKPWKVFSNGYQDDVLTSLFCTLGVTNRLFVDLGKTRFRTQLLQKQGWQSAYQHEQQAKKKQHEKQQEKQQLEKLQAQEKQHEKQPKDSTVTGRGLYEDSMPFPEDSQATPGNITALFEMYAGNTELDLATIADHSCDLQNFVTLTEKFRPRVMTVEYQPRWALDESKTNLCEQKNGEHFQWNGKDSLYGASLAAVRKAALKQNYSLVFVERGVDAFLVRNDLLCKDTSMLSLMTFQSTVACNPWKLNDPTPQDVAKWIKDY